MRKRCPIPERSLAFRHSSSGGTPCIESASSTQAGLSSAIDEGVQQFCNPLMSSNGALFNASPPSMEAGHFSTLFPAGGIAQSARVESGSSSYSFTTYNALHILPKNV